ncbi:hypothetical protein E0Z10_g4625 [Xylaria hypoxylon]|uniref:F-box domain-containing protein n=1 Tax=Xylaria hypoxylon TaxID=37992 RepID=A0A4Z0Z028_9PEZI|nr:hypothetical protein E0Z10_g4625 [Xylaria hypoxylon]
MSDPVPTASANPTTGAATDETRPTAVLSNNLCKHLAKMAMHEPTSLSVLPAELILDILGSLDMKRDWFSLARTCRRVSNVVVAELGKYNANEGNNYAFWYACVANKPTILLRHISLDVTVVNRHFTCNFMNPRIKFAFGQFMSPLAVAIRAGRGGIVRLLLANGADANLPDREPASKQCVLCYPINWAVDSKHDSSVAIIKMLKDHSADLNQVPKDWGKRRDEYPKRMKCAPIFRLLMLDKPPRRPHSSQPTSCEMYDNDFKKIQDLRLLQLIALLEGGADPNKRWDWDFVTPVFFLLASLAAYTPSFYFPNRLMLSHEEAAQASMVNDIVASFLDTLRDFGAHVHGLGNTYFYNEEEARAISAAYPETPLHAVCRLKDRHKPLIYWFLRNGTHIDVLGKASNTALMAYCGSNFKDTDQFQKFLRRRPVINHRDILGRTALHDLCANRLLQPQVKEKAVRMMLDAGADPTAVSDEKRDPTEELDFVTGSNNAYDEAANPTAVRNERRDSAQKIDPRIGRYDPHHTLREMLHNAAEKWKELNQKNEERLVLADKRPTNHRRGSRGGRGGGHANSRNENRSRGVGHRPSNHAAPEEGIEEIETEAEAEVEVEATIIPIMDRIPPAKATTKASLNNLTRPTLEEDSTGMFATADPTTVAEDAIKATTEGFTEVVSKAAAVEVASGAIVAQTGVVNTMANTTRGTTTEPKSEPRRAPTRSFPRISLFQIALLV